MDLTATKAELLRLERALAERDAGAVPNGLASLLDGGFFEFGSSGRTWDRETTADALRSMGAHADLEFADFVVRSLADDLVLVTYLLSGRAAGTRRTLRSSIWRSSPEGWRMLFHQGTPIPAGPAG